MNPDEAEVAKFKANLARLWRWIRRWIGIGMQVSLVAYAVHAGFHGKMVEALVAFMLLELVSINRKLL